MKLKKVSFFRHFFLVTLTVSMLFLLTAFITGGKLRHGSKSGPSIVREKEERVMALEGKILSKADLKALADEMTEADRFAGGLFLLFAISVAGSSLISLLSLMFYLRRKAQLAESVMEEIEVGKLDARFPVDRFDEFTKLMNHFNKMADKIKNLVLKLKEADNSRKILLQEISHDLKTPLASLLISLDSLEKRKDLSSDKKIEYICEAKQETSYISSLLEDLLFLSVVEDPEFRMHPASVDLEVLIDELLKSLRLKYPKLEISFDSSQSDSKALKADPLLLKRAFRNLLENSATFCRQQLRVTLQKNELNIVDDGEGFKPEILVNFGKKRLNTERIRDEEGQRKSTGLGSVIAYRILSCHEMTLHAENLTDREGRVLGAKIVVKLK